jgi:hypothetical protein
VEQESPEGLDDVQRFLVALAPRERRRYRLLRIGRKRLPDVEDHERLWAYVEAVGDAPEDILDLLAAEEYETKTRGRRHQPAARVAGEGVYALVRDGQETELAYQLELPHSPGPVQEELNIAPEARFVVSVKNPDAPTPRNVGLGGQRQADFPPGLRERFGGRRWVAVDPPEFLDHEGAELLFIGAAQDPGATAAEQLDPGEDQPAESDVFTRLRLDREEFPITPLLEGEWE